MTLNHSKLIKTVVRFLFGMTCTVEVRTTVLIDSL